MIKRFPAIAIAAAVGLFAVSARSDEAADMAKLQKNVPEAKSMKLAYSFDPSNSQTADEGKSFVYSVDNSKSLAGKKIKKIAYFLDLINADGSESFAFVSMDPFTNDVSKIGVPVKNADARFQTEVSNATVKSNVASVENGSFPTGCALEFWDCNYGPGNEKKLAGANDGKFDFGDAIASNNSPGYGSMQVNNVAKAQTVIAFNNLRAGKSADVGIGNAPSGNPDWTFAKNASSYKEALMLVLVETE